MPKLVNISTSPKTVGGWSSNGKKVLPRTLQPGETIELAKDEIFHPQVVALVNTGNFTLDDVSLTKDSSLDYANPPSGVHGSLLLISNGEVVSLPPGAEGEYLVVDSAEDYGLRWAAF